MIFDYGVLALEDRHAGSRDGIRELLTGVRDNGLSVVVVSTHARRLDVQMRNLGYPPADTLLFKSDVGNQNKGTRAWVREIHRRLGTDNGALLYVGDDMLDWREAINSATFYVHAGWSASQPLGTTCFVAAAPSDVWGLIQHYLLPGPRWEYRLDDASRGLHVRCLLGSGTQLIGSHSRRFTLVDVFTYHTPIEVGDSNAGDVLGLHAISSLYLEGLITENAFVTVYPSSTPGAVNRSIEQFLHPLARVFHSYYRPELFVRCRQAVDSSLARVAARNEGRFAEIPFSNQSDTVHLNPGLRKSLPGRPVIVFDDFTTSGMSLDWARNLLRASGAGAVTLVTIGKYGSNFTTREPRHNGTIQPFVAVEYDERDFDILRLPMTQDSGASDLTRRFIEAEARKRA